MHRYDEARAMVSLQINDYLSKRYFQPCGCCFQIYRIIYLNLSVSEIEIKIVRERERKREQNSNSIKSIGVLINFIAKNYIL